MPYGGNGRWELSKKVYPGSDGRVRHVDVQYRNHTEGGVKAMQTVQRPVHRLIVLVAADERNTEASE